MSRFFGFINRRLRIRAAAVVVFVATAGMGWTFWLAGFRLQSTPGQTGVFTFLAVFGCAFVLYGAALAALARCDEPAKGFAGTIFIMAVAALFRMLVLPAGISDGVTWEKIRNDLTGQAVVFDRFLLYDHDVWRYLWDGHQQAAGLNPYRYAPSELEPYTSPVFETDKTLEPRLFPSDLWRDIWENINYKDIPTIYPPVLQAVFRLSHTIAPGSVLVWKLLLLAVDLALCVVLAGILRTLNLPAHYLAAYAWNPLVIKEIAGSAHADVIPALFIMLALSAFLRARTALGSGWLACGMLAKLTPAVLLIFVWKRFGRRDWGVFLLVTLLGCLPFLSAGAQAAKGLSVYSREWIFNPGVFELFRWMSLCLLPSVNPSTPAKALCGVLYLGLLVWLWRRQETSPLDFVQKWLWALGGLVVLSSAVMPWYLVWVLPLAAVGHRYAWFVFSALCMLSYWVYIRGDGVEEAWRLAIIHGTFFLALLVEETKLKT